MVDRIKEGTKYLALVAMIIASATPLNSLFYTSTVIVFLILSVIVFFFHQKRLLMLSLSIRASAYALLIVLMMFITAVVNRDGDINYYIGLTVLVIGSFFLASSMTYEDFSKKYCDVITIIASYSSILTLYFNINKQLVYKLPLLYRPGQLLASWRSFHYVYYIWDIYARFSIVRNSACFREPGVWGCFASVAFILIIIRISKGEISRWNLYSLVIVGIGIFLSFSTTAWVCLTLAFSIYYYEGKHNVKQIIIVMSGVIIGITAVYYYQDLLFAKLFSSNSSHVSLVNRIIGISQSLECFKESPILGVGYTKYFGVVNSGVNAISYLYLIGEFGIILFFSRLYMEIKWIGCHKIKGFSKTLMFITLVLILCTQNLISMPIVYVLELYGAKTYTRTTSEGLSKLYKKDLNVIT